MKNKKGFTLVELLAVIAILAILVIIALPNVMGMFNEAKKNSFTTELKEIYKVAQQKWISDSMFNTEEKVYARCSSQQCANQLELTGRKELEYFIKISKSGNITEYYATDGTYQFGYKGDGLLITNITNIKSLADVKEEDKIQINCNNVNTSESMPELYSRLAAQSGNVSGTSYFLKTNIARKDIETITFTSSLSGHTANGTNCFDVSESNNGSVLAWVSDNNSNGLYEITIGANGIIQATSGRYLFGYLTNLTSIYGMYHLRTSGVTTMNCMFLHCEKITSIDLTSFDTSNVTDMKYMFSSCYQLTSLDLTSFNTSNTTEMGLMFNGNSNLRYIYAGYSFDTSKVTNSNNMFNNCSSLVGESGTAYNSAHIDKAYAHVDEGPSNPGYFKLKQKN